MIYLLVACIVGLTLAFAIERRDRRDADRLVLDLTAQAARYSEWMFRLDVVTVRHSPEAGPFVAGQLERSTVISTTLEQLELAATYGAACDGEVERFELFGPQQRVGDDAYVYTTLPSSKGSFVQCYLERRKGEAPPT